jgi:hypothetical protein
MSYEDSPEPYRPTEDVFSKFNEGVIAFIGAKVIRATSARMLGYKLDIELPWAALDQRSEQEVTALRATLSSGDMAARLTRALEITTAPREQNQDEVEPLVNDRAVAVLGLSKAALDTMDPDYTLTAFPLTFAELSNAAGEAMHQEPVGADTVEQWQVRNDQIIAAVGLAQDGFMAASIEANFDR